MRTRVRGVWGCSTQRTAAAATSAQELRRRLDKIGIRYSNDLGAVVLVLVLRNHCVGPGAGDPECSQPSGAFCAATAALPLNSSVPSGTRAQ